MFEIVTNQNILIVKKTDMAAMRGRMRKEIAMLESDPPFGISAWPKDDKIDQLEAQILGPDGSPYEKGVFQLEIEIPERYPFEPPKVRFITPIYHPNIDDGGRICLDTLKMQPKGSWLPSVNISTLLTTIRLLMAEPNADDGLMPEISDIFKHNRALFNQKATEMTMQLARATPTKPQAEATAASTEAAHLETEETEEIDTLTQDTVEAEVPSQRKESVSSDDSFSDGNSSSEGEGVDSGKEVDQATEEEAETPPTKRRRQE